MILCAQLLLSVTSGSLEVHSQPTPLLATTGHIAAAPLKYVVRMTKYMCTHKCKNETDHSKSYVKVCTMMLNHIYI